MERMDGHKKERKRGRKEGIKEGQGRQQKSADAHHRGDITELNEGNHYKKTQAQKQKQPAREGLNPQFL